MIQFYTKCRTYTDVSLPGCDSSIFVEPLILKDLLVLGSLSSQDGDGNENITKQEAASRLYSCAIYMDASVYGPGPEED